MCNKNDRASAISETGAVYHSGASDREFTPVFLLDSGSVLSTFVFLSFFVW